MSSIRPYASLIRALLIAALVLFSAASATAGQNADVRASSPAPRTLVLVLDGVPFRVVEAARERGVNIFAETCAVKRMWSRFLTYLI